MLSGSGAILLSVLVTKMIADWFADRELVMAMAILVTSWPLGIGLAMVTLPALAEAWSWQAAMVLTTILSLAGLAAVALVYRAPPAVGGEREVLPIRFGFGRRELLLVLLAGIIWALFNVTYAIIPGFAPGLLVSSGYAVVEASSMVSVVSWLLLLSLPLGGSLAQRLGRPNLVLVTCFTGLGLFCLLLALGPFPFPVLVALGLLFGPPAGIIMALPVEVLRLDHRALGMGLFFTCYYTVVPALTALAGFSLDASGNSVAPLFFGGLLMFVAIIVLALFRRKQRASA
jgi:MFS family permease